jgi:hypothetical protein
VGLRIGAGERRNRIVKGTTHEYSHIEDFTYAAVITPHLHFVPLASS